MFWRLDLDVRAASVAADDDYDANNPEARDTEAWSAAASALENAIAAVKAELRGRPSAGLLERAFARIGHQRTGTAQELADTCVALEPTLAGPAAELRTAG